MIFCKKLYNIRKSTHFGVLYETKTAEPSATAVFMRLLAVQMRFPTERLGLSYGGLCRLSLSFFDPTAYCSVCRRRSNHTGIGNVVSKLSHFLCACRFRVRGAVLSSSGKEIQPLRKDGMLLTALGASAVCTGISIYISLISQKTIAFMHPPLERYHIYAILCAPVPAILAVCSLYLRAKNRMLRAGTINNIYLKLAAGSAAMLLAFTATGLCYLKEASCGQISLLPVFTGTFVTVTEGVYILLPKTQ